MGKTIIILIAVLLICYLLYINGYMVTKCTKAVMYVGSKRGKKARFNSCSGYIKRVIKFEESRIYRITLDAELTKGEITAEIADKSKNIVAVLDSISNTAEIQAEKGKRYYLTMRFKSAAGQYEIDWK